MHGPLDGLLGGLGLLSGYDHAAQRPVAVVFKPQVVDKARRVASGSPLPYGR